MGECNHLKGQFKNCLRPDLIKDDYNLSYHVFPDGTHRIRCLSCGQKWFKDSPEWDKIYSMFKRSTNTVSRSEEATEYVDTSERGRNIKTEENKLR